MQQKSFIKLLLPMLWVFIVLNSACLFLGKRMEDAKIDHIVLMYSNILFFFLATISLALHVKAAKNPNPNVLVRSIMGSTLIKMIVIGTAVLVYVKITKENRSVGAVIIGMVLYIIYMMIEVKTALKLNKKQPTNASN